jgi:hypothetical protein
MVIVVAFLVILVLVGFTGSHSLVTIPDLCDQDMYDIYDSLLKQNIQAQYARANPVPHIQIDGLFDDELLRTVVSEFPKYNDGTELPPEGWHKSNVRVQNRKLEYSSYELLGPATKFLMAHLQSSIFIRFLSLLTGITGLVADPAIYGGGPHQTLEGGHLSIHLDYNYNQFIKMWRRVNVFVYLNEGWEEEWGGHLQLWEDLQTPSKFIFPGFNRLVVFTASEDSWHGHPDPLRCPPHHSRLSIAMYYYTTEDDPAYGGRAKRATDFRPRPNDNFTLSEIYMALGN